MATNVQASQAATRLSGHMPMKVCVYGDGERFWDGGIVCSCSRRFDDVRGFSRHLAEVCFDDPDVDSRPPRQCPFCGSEPELQVREKVGGGWLALVRCPACQACGPYVTGQECLSGLQMLAWHEWNRRAL